MSNMKAAVLVGLGFALTFTVFSAPAYASVVYDFTFENAEQNGGGTVDGTVTLPSSADGTFAASSVVVTSNTLGFGLGEYVGSGNLQENSFVISGGNITSPFFVVFGSGPADCCSLLFNPSFVAGLTDDPNEVGLGGPDAVTFTPAAAATPLPAALPLFATGIGAFGLLGWRRKRKARASLSGAA